MSLRRAPDRDRAISVLQALSGAPQTGHALAQHHGLTPDIAAMLWEARLLQGQVSDGCCQAPCGSDCIVAGRMTRPWLLTRKGHSTLKRWTKGKTSS